MADFETTVFTNQTYTEVWASAIVEIGTEDVIIENSIEKFMKTIFKLAQKNNITVYFHNLKFDGSFILDWLIRNKDFSEASSGELYERKFFRNKRYVKQ